MRGALNGAAAAAHRAGFAEPRRRGVWHAGPMAALLLAEMGLTAVLAAPAPASAQEATCELVGVGGYTYRTRFDSVSFVHHASGGIDYRCTDGMRLLADSAVVFESNEQVHLFGRVHLVDADTELDADTARYFGDLKQLLAWSNVAVRDLGSDAVITGQRLVYDMATEVRALDRMLVYEGSPHATVRPVARPAPPVEDSVAVGDSVPQTDSIAAGDGAVVQDSMAAPPLEDSAAAGDSVVVQDGMAAPPLEDSVAVGGEGVLDSAAVVGPGPEADSAAVGDTPPAEGSEDAAGGEEDPPVADTVVLSPYEIDAERFILEGRRHFRAGGDVVVVRDSLVAFGDSLDYDQEVGAMSIIGGARVEGEDYLLSASTVSVMPSTGLKEELLARRRARLSGRQVDMVAPAIRMFLDNGLVDRIVAIGEIPPLPGEPRGVDTAGLSPGDAARVLAIAEAAAARETDSLAVADSLFTPSVTADQFHLSGDSIDVLSPGQVLDLVTAVGAARAEGQPDDSVAAPDLPEVARRDWMEGDTIHARFASSDSTAAAGERGSRLETMTAVGEARSLYRLVDSDTAQVAVDGTPVGGDTVVASTGGGEAGATASDTTGTGQPVPPALHWVEGDRIIVYLEGRQVVRMDVEGQTVGYHLEPMPPGAPPDSAAAADTLDAVADSAAVRPDTAAVPIDADAAGRGAPLRPHTLTVRPGRRRP